MFTTAAILVIVALHEVKMSSQQKPLQSTIAKRATLSSEQILCITDSVMTELDGSSNAACLSAVTLLGNSLDVVQSIPAEQFFPEFCRRECGQVLINTWDACNAFDDIEGIANLLIGMCASNGDTTCYSYYNELFQYLGAGAACYQMYNATGTCSSQCSSQARDGVERYGCCANVPTDYADALLGIPGSADDLLMACNVARSTDCAKSPLSQPSSASHTVAVAVNISIIAAILAAMLHGN